MWRHITPSATERSNHDLKRTHKKIDEGAVGINFGDLDPYSAEQLGELAYVEADEHTGEEHIGSWLGGETFWDFIRPLKRRMRFRSNKEGVDIWMISPMPGPESDIKHKSGLDVTGDLVNMSIWQIRHAKYVLLFRQATTSTWFELWRKKGIGDISDTEFVKLMTLKDYIVH